MPLLSTLRGAVADDRLDVLIAIEQSLGRLTRKIRSEAIRKLLMGMSGLRIPHEDATTVAPLSEVMDFTGKDEFWSQKRPEFSATGMAGDETGKSHFLRHTSMQSLGMIGSDSASIRTFNSHVANIFQKYMELEDERGTGFRAPAQFDTGASSNFITRGMLNRIGRHKERDIPYDCIKTFISPINADQNTRPTRFIYVKMWKEQINFFDRKVKLKIIEVLEEWPIIIGRNLMLSPKNNETPCLLTRLAQSENEFPDDESFPELIAPLFKDRKSKSMCPLPSSQIRMLFNTLCAEQDILHKKVDEEHQRQTRQEFIERQMYLTNSQADCPSDVPPYNHSVTPSVVDVWRSHHSAPSVSQQITAHSPAGVLNNGGGWGLKRADTADTTSSQYTQYTKYSMGGLSSTSSASIVSYGTSDRPQTWKADETAPMAEGTQKGPRR